MGISICNRQRTRPLNLPCLRKIARALADQLFREGDYDLTIHLVATGEIVHLNETYVHHNGPTDVITFNYSSDDLKHPRQIALHGEIFVCVDVAITQARRFRTTWQSEVVRYIAHGFLHLKGYDDLRTEERRKMKREEARLLRLLARQFDFAHISRVSSS
jgi:probable rRNA maturation factor